MPYKSKRQERFFHTPTGKAKLGPEKVAEFDSASQGLDLPEKSRNDRGPGHHFRKAGGGRGVFDAMEKKGKGK